MAMPSSVSTGCSAESVLDATFVIVVEVGSVKFEFAFFGGLKFKKL